MQAYLLTIEYRVFQYVPSISISEQFEEHTFVMNGAQRCELHNRAVCRWVEWELSSVQFLLLPFWSRGTQRATLKELRLPWLSSLASQNGATGGITAHLSSARSCSCRAHAYGRVYCALQQLFLAVLAPALTTALDWIQDLLLLWPCS